MELDYLAQCYMECMVSENNEYDRFILWLGKRGLNVNNNKNFENYIRFKKAMMKFKLILL